MNAGADELTTNEWTHQKKDEFQMNSKEQKEKKKTQQTKMIISHWVAIQMRREKNEGKEEWVSVHSEPRKKWDGWAFIASDLPVCCVFLVSVGQFPEISQFSYVNLWNENGTENITTFNGMITVFCVLVLFSIFVVRLKR